MEDHVAQLTCYIPSDLEESVPRTGSHFSSLETLVARGDAKHSPYCGDAQFLALFGGEPARGTARAAVSHHAQYGSAEHEQWRIIASPGHLVADHATLHFPPQHHALLNDEESRALMDSCQAHFAEEGWQLDYGDANTWYLCVNGSHSITTTPIVDAIGKPLFDVLPQGSDARTWRRWINEAQMLFHTHAVNEAQQRRGAPPINTLWFWGEGCLPSVTQGRFSRVFGGDRYAQGLAQLSGAQWAPLPNGITAMSLSGQQGAILIVLDEASTTSWDSAWFGPLIDRLRDKSVSNMTLHFRNGYSTQLKPSMLWRFWRRRHFSLTMESAS